MRSVVLLLALLGVHAAEAVGQLPRWLRPGARLRVTTGDSARPLVGVFVSSGPDSLVIVRDRVSDTVTLSLAAARRIEVSRERSTYAGAAAVYGALAGCGATLLFIATSGDRVPPSSEAQVLLCGVAGGVGAGLGGAIGAQYPRDAWEPIGSESARLRIAPGSHGVSVGVSLRL